MKKISKFIKKNIKVIIAFYLGFILAGTSVYAANTIYSKNVTYDNSNSGLSATNVQDALDETYTKCFPPTATDDIINLYNDGSSINIVNIGGDTSNPQVKLNSNQGIMLDNNGDYRYYGANPNNYVEFNNETWRIIGVFNNVDDGTGRKETRLKIIRDESIGNYSWDSSPNSINSGKGVNDWSKADLMTELNNLYYNSKSGNCYNDQNNVSTACNFTNTGLGNTARTMIDDAIYYLGGIPSANLYVDDFYNYERGTTVYNCSTNDGACPRATTWTGKIGIIYSSDYLYSTDLSICKENGYGSDIPSCYNNNWMFIPGHQWTMSPSITSSYYVYLNNTSGHVNADNASYPLSVRPVLYLKSNIIITGGSGTSSNPYILR